MTLTAFVKPKHLISAVFYAGLAFPLAIGGGCHKANNPVPVIIINPLDLAPTDNEVAGWIAGESPNCFGQGVANDSNDLYRIIDGPGAPFVKNGFINGVFQTYIDTNSFSTGDTVPLCLQIFNQSTPARAAEIYKEQGNNYTPYIPINSLGDMARMDTAMTNIILETVYKNYYIHLMAFKRGTSTDTIYEQALLDFGSAIIKRIDAALRP